MDLFGGVGGLVVQFDTRLIEEAILKAFMDAQGEVSERSIMDYFEELLEEALADSNDVNAVSVEQARKTMRARVRLLTRMINARIKALLQRKLQSSERTPQSDGRNKSRLASVPVPPTMNKMGGVMNLRPCLQGGLI